MVNPANTTSRRRFLGLAGATGAAALTRVMAGAAPASAAPGWTGRQQLPPGSGTGTSVLILGAGIAGLTAAYELQRAGYTCTILEAQLRAGGRSFTARRGDTVTELAAGGGHAVQTCDFDAGLYLNLGPGRLPYHHRRVLRYCADLGIALEPYLAETTANLVQTPGGFGGMPVPNRQIANDTRGRIAELLSAAISSGALSDQLAHADVDTALELLRTFGDLDVDGGYAGSTRSGCAKPLSVTRQCEAPAPLTFQQLLDSKFWRTNFYQPIDHLWQATMFQPVGGMDMIVKGLLRKVGGLIRYGAPVIDVSIATDGVRVTWLENGKSRSQQADYCLSNIPLPVLSSSVTANFAPDFREAVDFVTFDPACKVGWQANTRFWESDRYEIYGGISRIKHNITQMWYPSYDYFTGRGTLTGAYNYSDDARAMGNLAPADRLTLAKQGGARLHPEFLDESIVPTSLGLSIAWQKVPYQLGGWAHWEDDAVHVPAYARLLSPDRRFHVIGDQVSPLDGWQEGAMMSAEHVVYQVAGLTPAIEAATVVHAPDSRKLTEGG